MNGNKKFISGHDIAVLAGLPLMTLLAWSTGENIWSIISRKISPHIGGIISRTPEQLQNRILQVMHNCEICSSPLEIARQLAAHEIETSLQIMRAHFPNGWRPNIELQGEEHLELALNRGKGAILWDSHFYFASLVTKMGLHERGYKIYHLSRREHGFSSTAFGMSVLNPIRTMVEKRYLRERLVIPIENPGRILKELADRLSQNSIVSITVRGESKQPVETPFFNGQLKIAPGAPVLSWNTGAALLPVFTIRRNIGEFLIRIGPLISVSQELERRKAVKTAALAYAKYLEPVVLAEPGQWVDWINI